MNPSFEVKTPKTYYDRQGRERTKWNTVGRGFLNYKHDSPTDIDNVAIELFSLPICGTLRAWPDKPEKDVSAHPNDADHLETAER